MNFGMLTFIGSLPVDRSLKFRIFENPTWRRLPSWKSQKSRYLCSGLTDLYEIWYGDAKYVCLTAPTVKNECQKSKTAAGRHFEKR